MELILTNAGRLNFTQMARCGRSCESRFRQNFKKAFDWFKSNMTFLETTNGRRIAIAIDPCYISKSGNVARTFARQQGLDLSVSSIKTLLHNAAMLDRFIVMSGNSPNMRFNNTDFKEFPFYGVRAVA